MAKGSVSGLWMMMFLRAAVRWFHFVFLSLRLYHRIPDSYVG